jgi:hypothetical protein
MCGKYMDLYSAYKKVNKKDEENTINDECRWQIEAVKLRNVLGAIFAFQIAVIKHTQASL